MVRYANEDKGNKKPQAIRKGFHYGRAMPIDQLSKVITGTGVLQ